MLLGQHFPLLNDDEKSLVTSYYSLLYNYTLDYNQTGESIESTSQTSNFEIFKTNRLSVPKLDFNQL